MNENQSINSLKVLTFNVWFDEVYFEERSRALVDLLKEKDPDIICLQEMTPRLLNYLKERKWIRNNFYLSDCDSKTVNPYGVVILSRIAPSVFSIHRLPTKMARKFLVCECEIRGEKLAIATVHLESLQHSNARELQLEIIFSLLSQYSSVLFMGDFNFYNEEEEEFLDATYIDIWPVVHPTLFGFTCVSKKREARLDRMLVRSNCFQPLEIELIGKDGLPGLELTPSLHETFLQGQVRISDHLGLFGHFSLPPSPPSFCDSSSSSAVSRPLFECSPPSPSSPSLSSP